MMSILSIVVVNPLPPSLSPPYFASHMSPSATRIYDPPKILMGVLTEDTGKELVRWECSPPPHFGASLGNIPVVSVPQI